MASAVDFLTSTRVSLTSQGLSGERPDPKHWHCINIIPARYATGACSDPVNFSPGNGDRTRDL